MSESPAATTIEVLEEKPSAVHALGHVDQYLAIGKESGASDIHLSVNIPPTWRRFGTLEPIWLQADKLRAADTEHLAMGFLNEAQKKLLQERGDVDFAYTNEAGRYRTSVVRHRLGYDLVFRIIQTNVRTMDELSLPPQLKMLTQYQNGLVLVTGSVGSGKSTTLAALVEEVNRTRHEHIITLEDPIEYLFTPQGCQVNQREVHTHTESFGAALRGALREDPDVIMVGEMRDLETIEAAVTAAETGHLVFGTLHTTGAARTITRIVDAFPANTKEMIRAQLSTSIVAVISQVLMRKAGGGRIAGFEIMVNTPSIANLIRENKIYLIESELQTGGKYGMIQLDAHLTRLVQEGKVDAEEAIEFAQKPDELRTKLGLPAAS